MSSSMSTIRVSSFDGPDSQPVIHSVSRPRLGDQAALIRIEACGVCGTDLHILRGHWPKRLPWPLTLGHELAGVIDEIGPGLETDFMEQPLAVGDKVMLPPLMPCGQCYYCVHYPKHANKCLNPTYYGRYIPFQKPPHLWGGWAEMVYVDLEMFPATKIYRLPDDMTAMLGSLTEPLACCIRALNRAVAADGFHVGCRDLGFATGTFGHASRSIENEHDFRIVLRRCGEAHQEQQNNGGS